MNNLDVQETQPVGLEIPLHVQWGDRIVFLGDSITQQRFFTDWVESYLTLRFTDLHLKFMNCGWGGETASGALARLDRDLFAFYPTLVVVAYGMNDAAYTDPDDGILERFSSSMQKLVSRIQKHKARVVLLTPGMVDIRMVPAYLREVDYNRQGVRRLADWVMQFGQEKGLPVYDLHQLMNSVAGKTGRFNGPLRLFQDGIHPNEMGHLVMAYALLKCLGVPERREEVSFDAAKGKIRTSGGVRAETVEGAPGGHFLVLHPDQPPFYIPPAAREILPFLPFQEDYNQLRLSVSGLPQEQYELRIDGQDCGIFSRQALKKGLNLFSFWETGPMRSSRALAEFTQEKSRIFYDLWRTMGMSGGYGEYHSGLHRAALGILPYMEEERLEMVRHSQRAFHVRLRPVEGTRTEPGPALVFLGTEGLSAGAQAGINPISTPEDPTAIMVEQGEWGRYLKVQLSTGVWSGGSVEIAPFPFGALRWAGMLEFEAKGSDGGELLAVGLGDATNGSMVRIFLKDQPMDPQKWKRYSVPLSAFPDKGEKWDEESQRNIPFPFSWDHIGRFLFDNNGPGQNSGLFLLRNIVVRWES